MQTHPKIFRIKNVKKKHFERQILGTTNPKKIYQEYSKFYPEVKYQVNKNIFLRIFEVASAFIIKHQNFNTIFYTIIF